MIESTTLFQVLILVIGFYMAWNIGANDVSNAMGTSVGSGALSLKKAVCLAAILEFCGAYFVGARVSETMQRGLIDTDAFLMEPTTLVLGMCAALLGTGIWLQIASYFGWPVSTTHAIVGAILGFGAIIGGVGAVHWEAVLSVAISWILSPLLSALISYLIFSILQRKILFAMNPLEATKKLFPPLVFIVLGTFTLSLLFNGLENLSLSFTAPQAIGIALAVGAIAMLIAYIALKKVPAWATETPSSNAFSPYTLISLEKAIKHLQRARFATQDKTSEEIAAILARVKILAAEADKESHFTKSSSEYQTVEKIFIVLQILSACYVAFAHGANDVSNAIGPVAAVLDIVSKGAISDFSPIPSWLLAFGGFGIVLGLATWGWRVIETIGKKITELSPSRGFCAEFGAATTILLASKFGLPISTTHCLVGAVLGVGLAGGIKALNLSMLREIAISWLVTIPASALTSILVFYLLRSIVS